MSETPGTMRIFDKQGWENERLKFKVSFLTAELTEAKRRIGELEAALKDEEKWYRRWAAWFHYHSGTPIQPGHTEGSWAEFLDGTLSMKPGIRNPARALLSKEVV